MRFSVVTSWYQYNQKTIERYLCENVDKPELQCNGKCFLNKNLAQQTEKEKPNSLGVLYKIDQFFAKPEMAIKKVISTEITNKKQTPHHPIFSDKSIKNRLFKPPIS